MGPLSIHDPLLIQTVERWMYDSTDLFVELHYPHTGSSGDYYLLTTIRDFNELLAGARRGAIVTVLRKQQYPIRGIVDDDLIDRAIAEVPDGEWYDIVRPWFYPTMLPLSGGGNNHQQYRKELEELRGEEVFTGRAPSLPAYWIKNDDEDSIIATIP